MRALWQGLMSGASRRLACPVCAEELLGLDKLTLHLYSHLPSPHDCTQNEAEVSSNAQCLLDTTRHISEQRHQEKKNTFKVKSSTLVNNLEERTEDSSKNEDQDSLKITGDFSPVHFMSIFHQQLNNPERAMKFNLNEISQRCQSSVVPADTLSDMQSLTASMGGSTSAEATPSTTAAGLSLYSCSPPQELPRAPYGKE